MKKTIDKYNCLFLINQHVQSRKYAADEKAAAYAFFRFLEGKDYGKGISYFRFDIYVEPEINFGHHTDVIYTACAHLSAHIDYHKFVIADSNIRH